jgi:hypothetical protein
MVAGHKHSSLSSGSPNNQQNVTQLDISATCDLVLLRHKSEDTRHNRAFTVLLNVIAVELNATPLNFVMIGVILLNVILLSITQNVIMIFAIL